VPRRSQIVAVNRQTTFAVPERPLRPSDLLANGRKRLVCLCKLSGGTTVSMPDTPENQGAFPQNSEQKPGLGFPFARIGGVISLASGAVLGHAVAACKGKGTGEQTLLRDLLPLIPGARRSSGRRRQ